MMSLWPMDIRDLTAFISVLAGGASLLQAAREAIRRRAELAAARQALEQERAERALAADNLEVLGEYLYGTLGTVTLEKYATDEAVQEQLDRVAKRVAQFVSPEGERSPEHDRPVPSQLATDAAPTARRDLIAQHGLNGPEEQIRAGNVWNGLAELRRIIETRFRAMAAEHDIRREKSGARRLLLELAKRELVPQEAVPFFEFAIEVANRGVHGLEVSVFEAMEAVSLTAQGFEIVRVWRSAV
jgi:hypothetical protein